MDCVAGYRFSLRIDITREYRFAYGYIGPNRPLEYPGKTDTIYMRKVTSALSLVDKGRLRDGGVIRVFFSLRAFLVAFRGDSLSPSSILVGGFLLNYVANHCCNRFWDLMCVCLVMISHMVNRLGY